MHGFFFQNDFIDTSANSANKIASAILGDTGSHSSLETGILLSTIINNYLTHERGEQHEYELFLVKIEKERKLVIQKWKAIDEKQEANYISLDCVFSLDSNTGKLKNTRIELISLPLNVESSFVERIQNKKIYSL